MNRSVFIKFVLPALVVAVVASLSFWRSPLPPLPTEGGIVGGGAMPMSGQAQPAVTGGGIVGGGNVVVRTADDGNGTQADPQFTHWLEAEALDVDKPSVDSERKRADLARVAATLTPAQARLLLQVARNDASPASEKILSVYILGEGGIRSRAELVELIQTPLPDRGVVTAHSLAETQSASDRAKLLMAIDALSAQAQSDPAALQALQKAVGAIQDSNIKTIAQKKIDGLHRH